MKNSNMNMREAANRLESLDTELAAIDALNYLLGEGSQKALYVVAKTVTYPTEFLPNVSSDAAEGLAKKGIAGMEAVITRLGESAMQDDTLGNDFETGKTNAMAVFSLSPSAAMSALRMELGALETNPGKYRKEFDFFAEMSYVGDKKADKDIDDISYGSKIRAFKAAMGKFIVELSDKIELRDKKKTAIDPSKLGATPRLSAKGIGKNKNIPPKLIC